MSVLPVLPVLKCRKMVGMVLAIMPGCAPESCLYCPYHLYCG